LAPLPKGLNVSSNQSSRVQTRVGLDASSQITFHFTPVRKGYLNREPQDAHSENKRGCEVYSERNGLVRAGLGKELKRVRGTPPPSPESCECERCGSLHRSHSPLESRNFPHGTASPRRSRVNSAQSHLGLPLQEKPCDDESRIGNERSQKKGLTPRSDSNEIRSGVNSTKKSLYAKAKADLRLLRESSVSVDAETE